MRADAVLCHAALALEPPARNQISTEAPAHQQEVDAAQHRVLQVVRAAVVLKLDVQAVLNAHLHLRGGITWLIVSSNMGAICRLLVVLGCPPSLHKFALWLG